MSQAYLEAARSYVAFVAFITMKQRYLEIAHDFMSRPRAAEGHQAIAPLLEIDAVCRLCGEELFGYAPDGAGLCENHYERVMSSPLAVAALVTGARLLRLSPAPAPVPPEPAQG